MRLARHRLVPLFVPLALLAASCGDGGASVPPTVPTTTVSIEGHRTPGVGSLPADTIPAEPSPGPVEPVRADIARAVAADVDPEEVASVVAGDTEFAFDLFRVAAEAGGNTVLSPYEVVTALTMTYAGARGETAEQMRAALHLSLPDGRLHVSRNGLDRHLTAGPDLPAGEDREPFTLRTVSSLWGQRGYPFREEFLRILAEEYGAGMNLVDFLADAERARRAMNAWVEDETGGRIAELVPEGVITDLTRLVLVDAIWFQANWATSFDPARTAAGDFTTLGGVGVTVPMMHGGGKMAYATGNRFVAVRLPYVGGVSMLVVLPDDGYFGEVAGSFGSAQLEEIRRTEEIRQVDLTMPRFAFGSRFALGSALRELGMTAAFTVPTLSGGADFTGMSERRELFVSDVVHQASITVDEQGTEAAAATAVVVGLTSAAPPATVTLDRPFLFLIQHGETGEILFIGQVTDPSRGA